ncbi:hypothetical protein BY996DRAFT_6816959 [Phakopsora pachyrhizi]|nr:hypothetical protein BY996DRAFT_6816959 [Phakopsora pachyrhizi]
MVGTSASTFLFGVTLTQFYTYFSNFKKDSFISDCIGHYVCCGCVTHNLLWLWFVKHYGEKGSVLESPWSFAVGPILCRIAAFVVQIFYPHK